MVHYNSPQMLNIAIKQYPIMLALCLMLSMTHYAQNYDRWVPNYNAIAAWMIANYSQLYVQIFIQM